MQQDAIWRRLRSSSGPGSFTGLRVGLAAIKALAEALRKPIAAVSLLEAVARSGTAQGRVAGGARCRAGATSMWATTNSTRKIQELAAQRTPAEPRRFSCRSQQQRPGRHARRRVGGSGVDAAGIQIELIEYPNSARDRAFGLGASPARPYGDVPKSWMPTTSAVPTPRFSRSQRCEAVTPCPRHPPCSAGRCARDSRDRAPDVERRPLDVRAIPQFGASERHRSGCRTFRRLPMSLERVSLCGFLCAQAIAGEWEIENMVVAAGFPPPGIASRIVARVDWAGAERRRRRRFCWKCGNRISARATLRKTRISRGRPPPRVLRNPRKTRSCTRYASNRDSYQRRTARFCTIFCAISNLRPSSTRWKILYENPLHPSRPCASL